MKTTISLFPSYRNANGTSTKQTWDSHVQKYFTKHDVRSLKDGPMFSPAIYEDNKVKRSDADVIGFQCIVLDIDNTMGTGKNAVPSNSQTLPEDQLDNIDGYTACWYSTHSNTKEWAKWRLILPLSRIVKPEEWSSVWQGMQVLLGDDYNIDMSCKDLSRVYWLPSCQARHKESAFIGKQDGEFIDPNYLMELVNIDLLEMDRSNSFQISKNPIERQGRNDQLRAMVSAMQAENHPFEYIVNQLIDYDKRKHIPPLFEDHKEGFNADPHSNAAKFVASIIFSHNRKRMRNGIEPEIPTFRTQPLVAETISQKIDQESAYHEPKKIDPWLLRPPGLLSEWVDWVNGTARKPQPIFALASAICGFGTIMGRRVEGWTGVRTNFYNVAIGSSSCGKQHPQNCITSIFKDLNVGDKFSMGQEVTSDSAILDALTKYPARLMITDEFGMWMAQVGSKNAGMHVANIATWLNRIFSHANQQPFYGKEFASGGIRKEKQEIACPNLSIYGSSTPNEYFSTLNKSSITSGFVPRLLIFQTESSSVYDSEPDLNFRDGPPSLLIEQLQRKLQMPENISPEGNLDLSNKPFIVCATKSAEEMLSEFADEMVDESVKFLDDGIDALFGKASEHALKLALLCACSMSDSPKIDKQCAEWAIEITRWSLHNTISAAIDRVADNELERQTKDSLRFFKERKSGCTRSLYSQKFKMIPAYTRKEIIETLKDAGEITVEEIQPQGGGRPKEIYRAA